MLTLILLVTYVLLGSLFISVAIPLVQGRVKPNPWYGFRVKKTMSDPEAWYAVNAYFGRRFVVLGLLIAMAGVALCPLGLIPKVGWVGYMAACHGITFVGLIWVIVDTFRYLRNF